MLDQLRMEMETDALVKFKNGPSMFGIILDYLQGTTLNNMKFVPNEWLKSYRATEHPQFIITLNEEKIEMVDVALK